MILSPITKALAIVMIVMSAVGYWYYKDSQATIAQLNQEIYQQRQVVQTYKESTERQSNTIDRLQDNLTRTTAELNSLTVRNNEIESEMQRYLDIFARHNLSKLAAAKPGLIEIRVNRGTKDVLQSIEEDSAIVSDTNP